MTTNLINLKAKINADVIDENTGEIFSTIKMEMYIRDLEKNADLIKGFEIQDYYLQDDTLVIRCIKWVKS